jgi:hypothetical protein
MVITCGGVWAEAAINSPAAPMLIALQNIGLLSNKIR